jgi:hypothetical protein
MWPTGSDANLDPGILGGVSSRVLQGMLGKVIQKQIDVS